MNEMALTADTRVTKYAALPADVYILRLTDIEEKPGQWGPFWIWKFEVEELPEAEEGVEWKTFHTMLTDNRTAPGVSRKNPNKSPRLAAAALLGRPLKDDELVEGYEYEDLIGKKCRASLVVAKVDGIEQNEIGSLMPLRGQSQRASIPPPATQEPLFPGDDGSEDIPFDLEPEQVAEAAEAGGGKKK